jgi:hypothetical protein
MDLTDTIAPRSDQLNADDLLVGPRTFTIENVCAGSLEQPVEIHLVGLPGRPFKPSKTVRRILVAAWGPDASTYTGRRMTLYRDPSIRFGKEEVGGIRVSHLSDIDKRIQIALTVTRGKRSPFVVDPLADEPTAVGADVVADFERQIAEARDDIELDIIARNLKAQNLGENRTRLQTAWSAKKSAMKSTDGETSL